MNPVPRTSIVYTLVTAPLAGDSRQLLVTIDDFQAVLDYVANWSLVNQFPITRYAKEHRLNPAAPPLPCPEAYLLTGRRDGLLLHVYDVGVKYTLDTPACVVNVVNELPTTFNLAKNPINPPSNHHL